jgi:hypothetical protein
MRLLHPLISMQMRFQMLEKMQDSMEAISIMTVSQTDSSHMSVVSPTPSRHQLISLSKSQMHVRSFEASHHRVRVSLHLIQATTTTSDSQISLSTVPHLVIQRQSSCTSKVSLRQLVSYSVNLTEPPIQIYQMQSSLLRLLEVYLS